MMPRPTVATPMDHFRWDFIPASIHHHDVSSCIDRREQKSPQKTESMEEEFHSRTITSGSRMIR